jgi:uncharacterized membrane protein (DUF4010 family)
VSSTAVTLSFARRAKETRALAPVGAGAVAVAWTIMLARVAVVVALIEPPLLRTLAIPLAGMLAATLLGLVLTFRRDHETQPTLELRNPFELASAVKVTLVFAVVLLISRAALEYVGDRGLYLASALGGTTDVDAVTVSTAKLAHGGISATTATVAIVIGIVVNTLVKTGLAIGIGGSALGKRVGLIGGLVLIAGALGIAITLL